MKGIDKKVIILNEVESTNNYAKQLILSGAAEEGTVVMTQFQIRGRGHGGNYWESEAGKNLLASMILFPAFLKAKDQFLLSKLVSLSILDLLKKEIDNVSVKWPNDIYAGDKKIAGILIENSIKGDSMYSSVLGIGLNLNQEEFFSDAPNPVSLRQITGIEYVVENVAYELFETILDRYGELDADKYEELNSEYLSRLYRNGAWHKYKSEGIVFEARIAGLGDFGQLLLEHRSGKVKSYMFKNVEFVL